MAVQWSIVSQTQASGQDDNGSYVRGRNVTWKDAAGNTGTVFVPTANLTEDYVRAKVDADVASVAAIAKLTSS
jgi:hypothetical protein